ncbi:MAG: cyclic nucleotide-binding/CBS domain-containing protein [Desulfobacterales bacterium]|nr:MAG: cyclic nucleotide-binding/CBS domain-containing protein [Desulfobacterales bacterium]
MNAFPWQRILDFLRTVPPFDTLSPEELAALAQQMQIAYYPRGGVIIAQGDPAPAGLYIIQEGSARTTFKDASGEEILVDVWGDGDVLGFVDVLQGTPALFDIIANEDLIAFLLPADIFKDLVSQNPIFKRYFSDTLAQALKSIRRSTATQYPQLSKPGPLAMDLGFIDKKVADLMTTDVLTCAPSTTIREAVKQMSRRRVSSVVIRDENGTAVGILTDRDLRSRVLAEDVSVDTAVAEVMSRPLRGISPQAYTFDALLEMSRHGIRYLPVVEEGRLRGIISDHDIKLETGSSPVGVVRDIEKSRSLEELIGTRTKIDNVRQMLLRQGGSIRKAVELITELNDRVTLKLLRLTEQAMADEGRGAPPAKYSWMALGSEGRREQTLRTDQDNALVCATEPGQDKGPVQKWFLTFAQRVVNGLARYGFPLCPGGIMASNPQWCLSEPEWRATFLGWVNDPSPETLRMASIFFDFRALYAGTGFLSDLRELLHAAIRKRPLFLRFLAKNSLYTRPPLGVLRQFIVEKSGEHKNKLDLKMRGLTPVVDAARVIALDLDIRPTNTLDRLEESHKRGFIDDALYADLQEAYGFISYLRIARHLEARAQGQEPDNFIAPEALNSLQRKMLKESFLVIHKLQDLLEFDYQTHLITGT